MFIYFANSKGVISFSTCYCHIHVCTCPSLTCVIVPSYNPNEDITVKAIVKLELGANIPVMTKLQSNLNELSSRALFLPQDHDEYRKHGIESMTVKYIDSWLQQWQWKSDCVKPSWKNLLMILREISPDLSDVADQVEGYFNQYSFECDSDGTDSEGIYTRVIMQCCFDKVCLCNIPNASESTVMVASKLRVKLAKLHSKPVETADLASSVEQSIDMCNDLLFKSEIEFVKKSMLAMQGMEFC